MESYEMNEVMVNDVEATDIEVVPAEAVEVLNGTSSGDVTVDPASMLLGAAATAIVGGTVYGVRKVVKKLGKKHKHEGDKDEPKKEAKTLLQKAADKLNKVAYKEETKTEKVEEKSEETTKTEEVKE